MKNQIIHRKLNTFLVDIEHFLNKKYWNQANNYALFIDHDVRSS